MRTLARWANSIVNHPKRFVWKCCINPNSRCLWRHVPYQHGSGYTPFSDTLISSSAGYTHIYIYIYIPHYIPVSRSNHHFYPLVNCHKKLWERSSMLSMGNSAISGILRRFSREPLTWWISRCRTKSGGISPTKLKMLLDIIGISCIGDISWTIAQSPKPSLCKAWC